MNYAKERKGNKSVIEITGVLYFLSDLFTYATLADRTRVLGYHVLSPSKNMSGSRSTLVLWIKPNLIFSCPYGSATFKKLWQPNKPTNQPTDLRANYTSNKMRPYLASFQNKGRRNKSKSIISLNKWTKGKKLKSIGPSNQNPCPIGS